MAFPSAPRTAAESDSGAMLPAIRKGSPRKKKVKKEMHSKMKMVLGKSVVTVGMNLVRGVSVTCVLSLNVAIGFVICVDGYRFLDAGSPELTWIFAPGGVFGVALTVVVSVVHLEGLREGAAA